jgi:DNA modification methylase
MSYRLIQGDCIEVMRAAKAESVHAIVCDPPYGIDFMGKSWDKPGEMVGTALGLSGGYQKFPPGVKRPEMKRSDPHLFQQWCEAWAIEAMRVLKPGGHILAFGGTRMYHRLAAGIEDAGFEIRDTIMWMYGSGFPKSHNVGKSIDKLLGTTDDRPVVGTQKDGVGAWNDYRHGEGAYPLDSEVPVTAPGSDEAAAWHGWGTALKPALEPIVVARKPLRVPGASPGRSRKATVAQNVLEHGAGAYNIDACRIGYVDDGDLAAAAAAKNPGRDDLVTSDVYGAGRPQQSINAEGRWPANVIIDEEAGALLDAQSGIRAAGASPAKKGLGSARVYGDAERSGVEKDRVQLDAGGASRFFYCPKAGRKERDRGLEERGNMHATVKPIALMRYLIRLVVVEGGVILDPFMGSGSTGIAALLEGMKFVGIEQDAAYHAIAQSRIAAWEQYR